VKEELGLPSAAELDVDLHSLLVYEPDQFFLRQQDTQKTDEMIGTLVVTLPSAYAGGELMIGKGEDWKAYPGTVAKLADLLREHFCTPATHSWGQRRADPPSRLVYLLDQKYTPRALKWTQMKGADPRRVPLLREAGEAGGCEAIVGLADVRTTHDA
jgi:hypothetical protein